MTTQIADSSHVEGEVYKNTAVLRVHQMHGSQPSPREVLDRLPADATPEQQDSAVQANIKPGLVHYSTEPDTLHLPGEKAGKSIMALDLPTYYKQSFFSGSPMFHPELPGVRLGVAGDPVPYTIASDNFITVILLGCFILMSLAFSKSSRFVYRQIKDFFFSPRIGTTTISETSAEVRYQLFFVLVTCLLFSIGYFFYAQTCFADTFTIGQFRLIGIYTAVIMGYFIFKFLAYWFSGWIFFDSKRTGQWSRSFVFLVSMEGVLLFPMVLLQVYFNLPLRTTFIYTAIVIFLVKILSFYKCYTIFFKRMGAILQLFLYFCALEIMPLAALWGALVMISNYMKINF